MSLLGIISRTPLRVQTIAANGSGWGFCVNSSVQRWTASAHRGGSGTVAVHPPSSDWFVRDDTDPIQPRGEAEVMGDVVIAAITMPSERATLVRSEPWLFVYEGTIAKGEALYAVLDPSWVVSPGLWRRPGTVIFAHFITYLANVGRTLTADAAMAKAVSDLRRARVLGSAAFMCSNGSRLYAYATGRPLRVSHGVGAIVVGSPEIMPDARSPHDVSDGSLVVLEKEPQLGWSIALETNPSAQGE